MVLSRGFPRPPSIHLSIKSRKPCRTSIHFSPGVPKSPDGSPSFTRSSSLLSLGPPKRQRITIVFWLPQLPSSSGAPRPTGARPSLTCVPMVAVVIPLFVLFVLYLALGKLDQAGIHICSWVGPWLRLTSTTSRLSLIPLRNDHLLPTAPWWPRLPTRFQEFQKLSSIRFMTRASVEGSHDPHHPLFPPPRSTLLYTPPNAQTSHLPDFRNTSFHPTKLGISPFTFILFGELLLETYTALFVVAPYSPRISRLAIPFNCLTSPSPSSPWMF